MFNIANQQQALVTVGLQSTPLSYNAQKQNGNPKANQPNKVFKQAFYSRANGNHPTKVHMAKANAYANTRMSTRQPNENTNYLGPCRETAGRVNLSVIWGKAQGGPSNAQV